MQCFRLAEDGPQVRQQPYAETDAAILSDGAQREASIPCGLRPVSASGVGDSDQRFPYFGWTIYHAIWKLWPRIADSLSFERRPPCEALTDRVSFGFMGP